MFSVRSNLAVCFTLLSLLCVGCTNALWQSKYQDEAVAGFYVDAQQHRLYAIGVRQSYVFAIGEDFQQVLILSRTLKFTPYLKDFRLGRNNEISGSVQLLVSTKDLDPQQVETLRRLGFRAGTNESVMSYEVSISGTRYESLGEYPAEKFKKPIRVGIALPRSGAETAQKIMLTPAAVSTDAVVSVPAGVVLVLIMATDSL